MDIAQYLADLLLDHKEVTIPGVGTICKETSPAKFNAATNAFDPPSVKLIFEENEKAPGLLAAYISGVKHISQNSADFFATRFGEETRQKLIADGKVDLSPVGWLENGHQGLQLTPLAEMNDTVNFGLNTLAELDPPKIRPDDTGKPPATADLTEYEYKAAADSSPVENQPAYLYKEDSAPSPFDQIVLRESSVWNDEIQMDENIEKSKKISRKWIVIGLLLLLVGGMAISALLFRPQLMKLYTKLVPPPAEAPKPVTKPAVVPLADSLTDSAALRNLNDTVVRKIDTTHAPAPVKTTAVRTKIEIIIGTFRTEPEARIYMQNMQNRGIPTTIVDRTPGSIKVSVGAYPDMTSAIKDIQRIKSSIDSTAYILPSTKK